MKATHMRTPQLRSGVQPSRLVFATTNCITAASWRGEEDAKREKGQEGRDEERKCNKNNTTTEEKHLLYFRFKSYHLTSTLILTNYFCAFQR